MFKKIIPFVALLALLLGACNNDGSRGEMAINDPLSIMTPAERQKKVPNKAFEAVYRRNGNTVNELLATDQGLFLNSNGEGYTPAIVAMRLREGDIAMAIIDKISDEDLKYKDSSGRGYLSHASEQGYVGIIELIGKKYKQSLSYGIARFYNIDFDDNMERHALFYAANGAVAEALKNLWLQWSVTWGASTTWFSGFYQATDLDGNNFLHLAAQNNRYDLIKWAVADNCGEKLFHDVEFAFGAVEKVGEAFDWLSGAAQLAPLVPDGLFNRQNAVAETASLQNVGQLGNQQNGGKDTPLHIAARLGHKEAMSNLISCRLTRYTIVNMMGRNPLAELIANADPNLPTIPQNRKDMLDPLLNRQDRYRTWMATVADRIDAQDMDGKSSLHHAARLNDPFFYKTLEGLGDVNLPDHQRRTPEEIYKSRTHD